jgi:hypothetical protein
LLDIQQNTLSEECRLKYLTSGTSHHTTLEEGNGDLKFSCMCYLGTCMRAIYIATVYMDLIIIMARDTVSLKITDFDVERCISIINTHDTFPHVILYFSLLSESDAIMSKNHLVVLR